MTLGLPKDLATQSSNQRYRSFAERYIIERVRNLPVVNLDVLHSLALEARTAYKMVNQIGLTVDD